MAKFYIYYRQQRCLCKLLGIKWYHRVRNDDVLYNRHWVPEWSANVPNYLTDNAGVAIHITGNNNFLE